MTVHYKPLAQAEDGHGIEFSSGMDYTSGNDYSSSVNFSSAFTYGPYAGLKHERNLYSSPSHTHSRRHSESAKLHRSIVETGVILLCFFGMFITLPFSLILSLKFVQSFERLVVFRLGRLQKEKGPGTVFVLPCVDSFRRVDLRTKAFNVPPIQAVTSDGGVVELGASIYYRIKDAMAAVLSIQDWNVSTRMLAHAALHRHINRLRCDDVLSDKRRLASDLLDELNRCTNPWGMEISDVTLSDVKTLKEGNSRALDVLRTLMQPDVGGRWLQGVAASAATSPVGADTDPLIASTGSLTASQLCCEQHHDEQAVSMDLHKMVFTLDAVVDAAVVAQVGYVYQIVARGLGDFYLDLKHGAGCVRVGRAPDDTPVDVTLTVDSADLFQLFLGQLSPLDAYRCGRVALEGSMRAAMRLQCLSTHISAKFGGGTDNDAYV